MRFDFLNKRERLKNISVFTISLIFIFFLFDLLHEFFFSDFLFLKRHFSWFDYSLERIFSKLHISFFTNKELPYYSSSILFGALSNFRVFLYYLITVVLLFYLNKNKVNWEALGLKKYFRLFFFFISLILTWQYSFYDYNIGEF